MARHRRHIQHIGQLIPADRIRQYIAHTQLDDLQFLQQLIDERTQELLAEEGANEFPAFARLAQTRLDQLTTLRKLIDHDQHHGYFAKHMTEPGFFHNYLRDYPTDPVFSAIHELWHIEEQLRVMQAAIGPIIQWQRRIRHAGFTINKTRHSQRSLSVYLYIPIREAEAFTIVFGRNFDIPRFEDMISHRPSDPEFSVRLSDHVTGVYYNQKEQAQRRYREADIDIYV
ncbi:hypothetical protein [Schleiferilactobacillus perolens]|jgi:hypothetical protein|uniref:Uncharacterized protein n=1 Tax=Schleiferilactobacillus perolens DSM 12744 TaxID=1423792 RepID=A0A0R1MVU9_9LACO|nr:hypothetical protein [Schleiferilactobacillus perolens]KRL12278.1 hypothetical protein FD09_GL003148 [Schleiferilactobacillus perolens DSM 12744]MCI1891226.1 hypothetical protein [Schleiferilactobacillus harbinensis]MCI1911836.1 hypothetical protein [Schleiferilactobacillus harbinensis]MCI2171607.1 hypothetical protein [Schleiferilactobacillus perolens]